MIAAGDGKDSITIRFGNEPALERQWTGLSSRTALFQPEDRAEG
jgi:hypothetical protein